MKYVLDVKTDEDTGEFYINLPDEVLDKAGLKVGDTIKWVDNNDGSWSLIKMEDKQKYFVVDVLSSFRCSYVVKAKCLEHALDEVTCRESDHTFKEFSQKHIGASIIDGYEVSRQEVLDLNKVDNSYLKNWSEEMVINGLVNEINYGENDVQESNN